MNGKDPPWWANPAFLWTFGFAFLAFCFFVFFDGRVLLARVGINW